MKICIGRCASSRQEQKMVVTYTRAACYAFNTWSSSLQVFASSCSHAWVLRNQIPVLLRTVSLSIIAGDCFLVRGEVIVGG